MSCQQLQQDFVPFLLGELEHQAASVIETHLATGCTECVNDFVILREAVETVFAAVPAAALPIEQQQRIRRMAVREWGPGREAFELSPTAAAVGSVQLQTASTPWRMLQALLSLAAGFFLIVGWQAWQNDGRLDNSLQSRTTAATDGATVAAQALSGDPQLLPRAKDKVHFVSVKNSPTQLPVTGYFLADRFSSQLHVVGKIAQLPQPEAHYQLTIATDRSTLQVPISVEAEGHFKVIVALPESAIREVVLEAVLNATSVN